MTAAPLHFLEQDAFEEDTRSGMLPLPFTEATGIGFGGPGRPQGRPPRHSLAIERGTGLIHMERKCPFPTRQTDMG